VSLLRFSLRRFIEKIRMTVEKGEEDRLSFRTLQIGINVIINERHKGLLYKDEVYDDA
jgi:hypothetical protein